MGLGSLQFVFQKQTQSSGEKKKKHTEVRLKVPSGEVFSDLKTFLKGKTHSKRVLNLRVPLLDSLICGSPLTGVKPKDAGQLVSICIKYTTFIPQSCLEVQS